MIESCSIIKYSRIWEEKRIFYASSPTQRAIFILQSYIIFLHKSIVLT